jgi:hypothetical protein
MTVLAFLVVKATTRVESLRTNVGTLLFMIILALSGWMFHIDVWYAMVPLIIVYAFFGLVEFLKRTARERLLYSAVVVLTGFLLVHSQIDFYRGNKPSMAAAISQASELRIAAEWVKMNASSNQSVCAKQPGIIEYYSERPVGLMSSPGLSGGDLLVTSQRDVAEYEIVFQPEMTPDPSSDGVRHNAVWRRK